MSEVGKTISHAIAYVSRVGEECEALANLIKSEVSDVFLKSKSSNVYKPGEWSSSYKTDTHGWIFSDVAWTLPLTPKRKQKATAHFAFQMSFLCNNLEGGSSPEPLLHINLWDEPTDFKQDSYMGFEMHDIAQGTLARLHDGGAKLFRWETGNGDADRWTFTVRLADLNTLNDVRTLICDPLNQVLADVDQGEAALENIHNVVRYRAVDEVPDYYRVVC
jgi:hypothetical protein